MHHRRPLLPLAVLALLACADGGRDTAARLDSGRPAAARPETGAAPAPARPTPAAADSVYVDRGACPFECCQYGRWRASAAVALRDRPDSLAPVIGRIAAGTKLTAETGAVHAHPARWVLRQAQEPFAAGDTVLVYRPEGEGYWMVRGLAATDTMASITVDGPGPRCAGAVAGCLGRWLEQPRWVWWARVRTDDGRTGWVMPGGDLDGDDACGAERVTLRDRRTTNGRRCATRAA